MKRVRFITQAMYELLIPSEGINNLFPNWLSGLQKNDISFFGLQAFPHVGDIVVGLDSVPILCKAKSIIWPNNNRVKMATKDEKDFPITKVYPICISNEILLRLGFKWDERFRKFRLRLKSFPNIDLEKSSGSENYYIKEIGNIQYLHELQAVLRIYHIDKGILDNKLWVAKNVSELNWINNIINK